MELNVIPVQARWGEWVSCNRCWGNTSGLHCPLSSLRSSRWWLGGPTSAVYRERRVLLANYNSIIVSGQMYGSMAAIELEDNRYII